MTAQLQFREMCDNLRVAAKAYNDHEEKVAKEGGLFTEWVILAETFRAVALKPKNILALLDRIDGLQRGIVVLMEGPVCGNCDRETKPEPYGSPCHDCKWMDAANGRTS